MAEQSLQSVRTDVGPPSSLVDQLMITIAFITILGLMLGGTAVSGVIIVSLGGKLLRSSGVEAATDVSSVEFASVGAVGAVLAYLAMIFVGTSYLLRWSDCG